MLEEYFLNSVKSKFLKSIFATCLCVSTKIHDCQVCTFTNLHPHFCTQSHTISRTYMSVRTLKVLNCVHNIFKLTLDLWHISGKWGRFKNAKKNFACEGHDSDQTKSPLFSFLRYCHTNMKLFIIFCKNKESLP